MNLIENTIVKHSCKKIAVVNVVAFGFFTITWNNLFNGSLQV